jgi:hypothetical protein
MDKKEICAFLIGCEVGDFMGYADKGDEGAVIIGPDGKKYRYDAAQLEQAERKAEARRSEAQAPKPKPKRTTKRKPASKPTSKPKTGAKS